MVKKRENLLTEIEKIISQLKKPLTRLEIDNGWSETLQVRWKTFFEKMYEDVKSGQPLAKFPQYGPLLRGLDSSGITKGSLFELAAHVASLYIEEKEAEAKKWWQFWK